MKHLQYEHPLLFFFGFDISWHVYPHSFPVYTPKETTSCCFAITWFLMTNHEDIVLIPSLSALPVSFPLKINIWFFQTTCICSVVLLSSFVLCHNLYCHSIAEHMTYSWMAVLCRVSWYSFLKLRFVYLCCYNEIICFYVCNLGFIWPRKLSWILSIFGATED